MTDTVISVEGLGKRYVVSSRPQSGTMTLGAQVGAACSNAWRRVRSLARGRLLPSDTKDFWALRDVTFEVKRGEVLGIVGHNGAGKSTLLKLLSRITDPSEGHATIHGRVASLLEVGTGFHEELSGRDNVYFAGSILGMHRAEIAAKFDEIVAFAGVGEFIDLAIKRYSSGMKVRLGFAVAAHLDPEIMIVDEVLAVGDVMFQKRCTEKMGDVASHGRTIVVVSHNMDLVRRLTTRCVVLESGRITMNGPTEAVVQQYLRHAVSRSAEGAELQDRVDRTDKAATVVGFAMRTGSGLDASACSMGDSLVLSVDVLLLTAMEDLRVVIRVMTFDGRPLYELVSSDSGLSISGEPGPLCVQASLECLRLYPGLYNLAVSIWDSSGKAPHAWVDPVATLQVIGGAYPKVIRRLNPAWGVIYEPATWSVDPVARTP